MLLMPKKKQIVSMVMGKLRGDEPSGPSHESGGEIPSLSEIAAGRLLDAVKGDDPKAVLEAFKSLLEACESEEQPEEMGPAPEGME